MIILGIVALGIVAVFATSLGTILLGAVVIAVVLYLLMIVGGRLNDWLRHGKPLMRRRSSAGGQSGGDES